MTRHDYSLHQLGWRAFRDLCAVIMREVFGQDFTTFADSTDGGRDGTFQGRSMNARALRHDKEALDGDEPTVAQCKRGTSADETLAPSILSEEIEKALSLNDDGLRDHYIFMISLEPSAGT